MNITHKSKALKARLKKIYDSLVETEKEYEGVFLENTNAAKKHMIAVKAVNELLNSAAFQEELAKPTPKKKKTYYRK